MRPKFSLLRGSGLKYPLGDAVHSDVCSPSYEGVD